MSWKTEARELLFHCEGIFVASTCPACDGPRDEPGDSLCPACRQGLGEELGGLLDCPCCGLRHPPGAPGAHRPALCPTCSDRGRSFWVARSVGQHAGALSRLIARMKYGRDIRLCRGLATWMAVHAREAMSLGVYDLLVPIPLHRSRLRSRGFNQAAILAAALSRDTGIPLSHPLRRCRSTRTQAGLSLRDRRANTRGAFRARRRPGVEGRRILLLDDVMTSGATAEACADVLLGAGATGVDVLVLARAGRAAPLSGSVLSGQDPPRRPPVGRLLSSEARTQ